jgi:putative endopeptidase
MLPTQKNFRSKSTDWFGIFFSLTQPTNATHTHRAHCSYVNGNWLDTNPVPSERTRWSSFDICSETILADLQAIVKECKETDGKAAECVSRFWAAAMDEAKIEALGLKPIQPLLDDIDAVATADKLGPVLAKLNLVGVGGFMNYHVAGDFKNSNQEVFWLGGAGFGLPDRDYYLDDNKEEQRAQYLVYIAAMFKAAGVSDDEATLTGLAQVVLNLETALAKVTLSRTDRMNPEKSYNPTTLEEVSSKLLPIDFESYARELGVWGRLTGDDVPDKGPLVLTTPEYFTEGVQKVLKDFSMDDIRT